MNDTARNFIDHLERDLLQANHLLQSGLETAFERLGSAAQKSTAAMTDQAITKLRALEDLNEKSICTIQEHLGRLNYLAAVGEIKSCHDFDQLAQPLSEALHDARASLVRLDEIGRQELGTIAGAIGEAWADLHLALDCARLELSLSEMDSKEEADSVRQDLTERYEEALKLAKAKEAKTLGDKLHDTAQFLVSRLGDGFKTLFFLSRDIPSWRSDPKSKSKSKSKLELELESD